MNVIRVGDAKFVPQALPVTDPLYQPHSLLYYQHYYQHSHVDLSFAVVLGGQVYAMVWLTKHQQRFDYYGLPMLFWLDSRADDKARQGAFKVACKELTKLRQQHEITQLYYQQPAGVLDPFSEYLLQQGFTPQLQVTQSVDLTQPEDMLWAQLRDVYHSNIRFGQQHLRYQLLQRDESSVPGLEWLQPHDFCLEPMREFHIKVAGRETRSAQSWRAQEQMLMQGEAFALLGFSDGTLLSTGLFIYNQQRCYYGVGVYDRDYFDVPVSHDLVWRGMLHAKRLGCQQFDFGALAFAGLSSHGQAPSPKDVSIGHFKRGFGGQLSSVLCF